MIYYLDDLLYKSILYITIMVLGIEFVYYYPLESIYFQWLFTGS